MDHSKKLDFIHKMAKLGLEHVQHFDQGGQVSAQDATPSLVGGPDSRGTNQSYADPQTSLGGGVSKFLGLASSYNAGGADIQNGTNVDQLNDAYQNARGTIGAQSGLANTLTPQAQQAVNQQNSLAQSYQGILNGTGPNVALNQLHQATADNTANQAALMASQRGTSANPGLIARQAAMQGANNQQQAVSQAATLQAQQQIAAQQGLAQLSGQQIGQTQGSLSNVGQAAQNQENILQNANTASNNANVGMQSNINTTNAQTASANANSLGGLIGGGISAIGSIFGAAAAEGGEVTKKGMVHPQMMAEGGNAHISGNPLIGQEAPAQGPQSYVGQWLASASPANTGGPNVQLTPFSMPDNSQEKKDIANGLTSAFGKQKPGIYGSAGNLPGYGYTDADSMPIGSTAQAGGTAETRADAGLGELFAAADGGMVPAMVSPGERYLSPKEAKKVAKGEKAPLKAGEKIPGKPKFPGNDYRNDIVPKKLKEGGIVIPNKVLQSKNPGHEAKKFVIATMAKRGLRK